MTHISYLIVASLAVFAAFTVTATAQTSGAGGQPATNHSRQMDLDSYTLLGQIALEHGQRTDALNDLLKATQLSEDPRLAAQTARLAYELGSTDIGLEVTKRWRKLQPTDPRIHWYVGVFNLRQGSIKAATQEFTQFVKAANDADKGLALVADALGQEANISGATEIMQALVDEFPDTQSGDFALARLALRAGNPNLALPHARKTVDKRPDWIPGQLIYSSALLAAGKTDQGLAVIADLAKKHDDNVAVQLQYAESLLDSGKAEEAHGLLEKIAKAHPGVPEVTRALGFAALSTNDLDTAEREFGILRNEDRYRDEAFYYLGRIAEMRDQPLQATRDYSRVIKGAHAIEAQARTARIMFEDQHNGEGALQHLKQFGEANPTFATSMLIVRAQLLLQMKRSDDAIALLHSALAKDPDNKSLQDADAQLYVTLAQQASDEKAYDKAQTLIDEGLDRHPDQRALRYAEALLLQQRGEARKSAKILEKLVKEYPDDPTMLNALGYLLTDQLDRSEEARKYIEKALAKLPDNPAIIDSMGWVLYQLGEYSSAYGYLERAYKLFPDPEVAAHLINVQWALGHKDAALTLLDAALKKNPDDERLKALSTKLN